MDYRYGKIAQQIIELQNEDGTWGSQFHSLAIPNNKKALTTEQALRRLKSLGFSMQDEPIQKAVDCMQAYLCGERRIDNYWEKTHDWELFTKLMLSTWIKVFEPKNKMALDFAKRWANVIEETFLNGAYNAEVYQNAYCIEFGKKPRGAREIDFVTFYHMNLLQGVLTKETESRMLDYIINYDKGIYYVYGKRIKDLPKVFPSLETSRYLAAVEILSEYDLAREKLGFVVNWAEENKDAFGQWDLGANVKDNIYFPLSDSWRNVEFRKADCTEKIQTIIKKLSADKL